MDDGATVDASGVEGGGKPSKSRRDKTKLTAAELLSMNQQARVLLEKHSIPVGKRAKCTKNELLQLSDTIGARCKRSWSREEVLSAILAKDAENRPASRAQPTVATTVSPAPSSGLLDNLPAISMV